jgi:hypothetical protein
MDPSDNHGLFEASKDEVDSFFNDPEEDRNNPQRFAAFEQGQCSRSCEAKSVTPVDNGVIKEPLPPLAANLTAGSSSKDRGKQPIQQPVRSSRLPELETITNSDNYNPLAAVGVTSQESLYAYQRACDTFVGQYVPPSSPYHMADNGRSDYDEENGSRGRSRVRACDLYHGFTDKPAALESNSKKKPRTTREKSTDADKEENQMPASLEPGGSASTFVFNADVLAEEKSTTAEQDENARIVPLGTRRNNRPRPGDRFLISAVPPVEDIGYEGPRSRRLKSPPPPVEDNDHQVPKGRPWKPSPLLITGSGHPVLNRRDLNSPPRHARKDAYRSPTRGRRLKSPPPPATSSVTQAPNAQHPRSPTRPARNGGRGPATRSQRQKSPPPTRGNEYMRPPLPTTIPMPLSEALAPPLPITIPMPLKEASEPLSSDPSISEGETVVEVSFLGSDDTTMQNCEASTQSDETQSSERVAGNASGCTLLNRESTFLPGADASTGDDPSEYQKLKLPEHWIQGFTPKGEVYFGHLVRQNISLKVPSGSRIRPTGENPAGWEVKYTVERNAVFIDKRTMKGSLKWPKGAKIGGFGVLPRGFKAYIDRTGRIRFTITRLQIPFKTYRKPGYYRPYREPSPIPPVPYFPMRLMNRSHSVQEPANANEASGRGPSTDYADAFTQTGLPDAFSQTSLLDASTQRDLPDASSQSLPNQRINPRKSGGLFKRLLKKSSGWFQ